MKEIIKYLRVLDRQSCDNKSKFFLQCGIEGLEIDDKKYDELLKYEIEQLKNIKQISKMFDEFPERSLFEYKKHFHLVLSAKVQTARDGFGKEFNVKAVEVNPGKNADFNFSLELAKDMEAMYGVDVDSEIWHILSYESLQR